MFNIDKNENQLDEIEKTKKILLELENNLEYEEFLIN